MANGTLMNRYVTVLFASVGHLMLFTHRNLTKSGSAYFSSIRKKAFSTSANVMNLRNQKRSKMLISSGSTAGPLYKESFKKLSFFIETVVKNYCQLSSILFKWNHWKVR